jgi:hypothetical protein
MKIIELMKTWMLIERFNDALTLASMLNFKCPKGPVINHASNDNTGIEFVENTKDAIWIAWSSVAEHMPIQSKF